MTLQRILVVEDDAALREALVDILQAANFNVVACADGHAALTCLDTEEISLVLSDVNMAPLDGHALLRQIKNRWPNIPVVLMTAYGTIQKAVTAMRDGAADYLVKPFEAQVLVTMMSRLLPDVPSFAGDVVACDPRTREVMELARRVACSDATVLLLGPSGSGKEVFARYIHRQSPRANAAFVAINCAAIPENMLEAMLFGYEKGAFTGAHQSAPGKFELAQDGTLLLDEISEMGLAPQAKLLRVLQEREVERLGGRKPIKLNVRVLATSNRNLREEVRAGRFREDLYYRLQVFPLQLPPLAERNGDIIPLAKYLIEHHCPHQGITLAENAQLRLLRHTWPGNVRELDNVIQRALILRVANTITAEDIHYESTSGEAAESVQLGGHESDPASLNSQLKSQEFQVILEALRAADGDRHTVAERLGISARTLRYKLAQMRDAGLEI